MPTAVLEPDAIAAPVVQRIFTQYVAGGGLQLIAESLTADGILCPSAYDRARNPHFGGVAWSKGTVRAILMNRRYAETEGTGPSHVPLVDRELFLRVQEIFVRKRTRPGVRADGGDRLYRFRGVLRCGYCNRVMQGTWNNGEPYYRCRFPARYADANSITHPRNVYLRERRLLRPLHQWLASHCPPWRLAQGLRPADGPPPHHEPVEARMRLIEDETPVAQADLYQRLRLRLTYLSHELPVRSKITIAPPGTVARGVLEL